MTFGFYPAAPVAAVAPFREVRAQTADFSSASLTYVDVGTNMVFALSANKKYAFRFVLFHGNATTTNGVMFSLNGPAAVASGLRYGFTLSTSTSAELQHYMTTYDDSRVATASTVVDGISYIEGVVEVSGAGGNLVVRIKNELNSSSHTVRRGSYGQVWETTN